MSRQVRTGLGLVATGLAAAAAFSSAAPARTAAVPRNTGQPRITGGFTVGHTVTIGNGAWANGPTSFQYQWFRCDNPGKTSCAQIAGQARRSYRLGGGDAGHTIYAAVTACNRDGCATAATDAYGPVKPNAVPVDTAAPSISGNVVVGSTLTANEGAWTNVPTGFAYEWLRCDVNGANCGAIGGAVAKTYTVGTADLGATLRVRIAARNTRGWGSAATSAQTAAVGTGTGGSAVPVTTIVQPDRLLVKTVEFTPSILRSRGTITARFEVTDEKGIPVAGAQVLAIGLPYIWIESAPQVQTGNDGWATVTFRPTKALPRRAALVFFVRASKPGDTTLAGVSSRRLVQLSVRL